MQSELVGGSKEKQEKKQGRKIVVKNFKVVNKEIVDLAKKLLAKYKYLKWTARDEKTIAALTPPATATVTYELHNANTALANAFRRVILDEFEWPRINPKSENIATDDPFCLRMTDYILNRIWLIPTMLVDRDAETEKIELTLNYRNDTDKPVVIKSDLFECNTPRFKWDTMIDIAEIQPGKFIRGKFCLEFGINLTHASFSRLFAVTYRQMDYREPYPDATTVHPTTYEVGFSYSPWAVKSANDICIRAWKTIKKKLQDAKAAVADYAANAKTFVKNDRLGVSQIKGNRTRYEFYNETYTLGNLISWYVYEQDKNIGYINAGDDHPEDRSILVRITHPEHATIIQNACTACIADVDDIIEQLQ